MYCAGINQPEIDWEKLNEHREHRNAIIRKWPEQAPSNGKEERAVRTVLHRQTGEGKEELSEVPGEGEGVRKKTAGFF